MSTSRGESEKEKGTGGDGFKVLFHPVILLQPHLLSFSQTQHKDHLCCELYPQTKGLFSRFLEKNKKN